MENSSSHSLKNIRKGNFSMKLGQNGRAQNKWNLFDTLLIAN